MSTRRISMSWFRNNKPTVDWAAEKNKQISGLLQAFPRTTEVEKNTLPQGLMGFDIRINASPSAFLRITLPTRFPEAAPHLKIFGLRINHPYFDSSMSVTNMNELKNWYPQGSKLSDVVKKVLAEVESYNPNLQRQQPPQQVGMYGGRPYTPGQPIQYSFVGNMANHGYLSNAGNQNMQQSQQQQQQPRPMPPQQLLYGQQNQQQTSYSNFQNPPNSNSNMINYQTTPSYQETQNRPFTPQQSSTKIPPKAQKSKAEIEEECVQIKMKNFLKQHPLEVPEKFEEIENLPLSRLQLLDKDTNSFAMFFFEYTQKKKFDYLVTIAQDENGKIADTNLQLNDEYNNLIKELTELKGQLEVEKEKIEEKLSQNVKILDSDTLKARVHQEANQIEQRTDNLADMIEDGQIKPADFVERYVKERTNYHRYKAQLEHISP